MDPSHVVLEMHHVIENHPLRLTYRVAAYYLLICCFIFQMNILNVVHHDRGTAKGLCSIWQGQFFVPDAKYALGLLADDGKEIRIRGGIRRFFLGLGAAGENRPLLAGLTLLPRGEFDHEVDGLDSAFHDVFYA
jgi:hypothetical protein